MLSYKLLYGGDNTQNKYLVIISWFFCVMYVLKTFVLVVVLELSYNLIASTLRLSIDILDIGGSLLMMVVDTSNCFGLSYKLFGLVLVEIG